jgi:hypothetical protein
MEKAGVALRSTAKKKVFRQIERLKIICFS